MEFTAKKLSVTDHKTDCAVVFVEQKKLLPSSTLIDTATNGLLKQLINSGDLKPEAGSVSLVNAFQDQPYKRVLLVQLGKTNVKNDRCFKTNALLKCFNSITRVMNLNANNICVFFDDIKADTENSNHWLAQQFAQTLIKKDYTFNTCKSKKKSTHTLKKVVLASSEAKQTADYKKGLLFGNAFGKGINHARELGNLPGNICTPTYLANEAKKLAKAFPSITSNSLNEKQMEKLGMGSLLSVSRGSVEEARLIVIEYKSKTLSTKSKSKPHVLVGKGITFDTGGISLKPGAGMDEMKFDMCGAASVIGTITALATMEAKAHVVGIIAAAENMPSGIATKPGDIVTSMSGQTIEVLNTDAEGRLVLCDALTYAEKFSPKTVVDIATLTGACVIALGHHATAIYSNQQKLANALLEAGENSHDKAWQMPLWDEYQRQLDSNFADIANIGGRPAGSITAACFLSRFTKKYQWAHLDIAGTAWHSGSKKGATGRPVSLLTQYILDN